MYTKSSLASAGLAMSVVLQVTVVPLHAIEVGQLTFDPAEDMHPAWSPDGVSIAFPSTRSGNWDIWVIPAIGGVATQVTTYSGRDDFRPSWSPDGIYLAYTSSHVGQNIFRIRSTGEDETPLTWNTSDINPSWSPDGEWIAFQRFVPWSSTNIFVIPAEGGATTQLTSGFHFDGSPCWSPDGSQIAYMRDYDIWLMSAKGENQRSLTWNTWIDRPDSWSPDGMFLAFSSDRSGNWDIWVMPSAGGEAIQLTADPSDDFWASWSPDGTQMVFWSNRSGNDDLWILSDLPDFSSPTDVVTAPSKSILAQNVPNPFNPNTSIRYSLPEVSPVRLAVYDVRGRLVRTLVTGTKAAGESEVTWDGRNERGLAMPSGVYIYELRAGQSSQSSRMILMR